MHVDPKTGALHLKVVYWGPNHSALEDYLRLIHARARPTRRGELERVLEVVDDSGIPVRDERRVQLDTGLRDPPVRLHLHAVGGPVLHPIVYTRLLEQVDGVVVLVDLNWSQNEIVHETLAEILAQTLEEFGRALAELPIVVHYTNAGPTDARSIQTLARALELDAYPAFVSADLVDCRYLAPLRALVRELLRRHRAAG